MPPLVTGVAGCFINLSIAHAASGSGSSAVWAGLPDLATQAEAHSLWIVFAIVLVQQLGLPVPAFPALLIAGSIAESVAQLTRLIVVAAVASLCADLVWYCAGRAFGSRVLTALCKLSVEPGSCIATAERFFMRWGVSSLVVAKFVPGFAAVGPPIAGALKLPLRGFLLASTIGATLWAGVGVLAGWIGRVQVREVVNLVTRQGSLAFLMVAVAVLAWLGWLIWRKRRFDRSAAAISVSRRSN